MCQAIFFFTEEHILPSVHCDSEVEGKTVRDNHAVEIIARQLIVQIIFIFFLNCVWQLHDLSGYGSKHILLIYLSSWFLTLSTEFSSHLKETSANVSVSTPWWHLRGRRCFITRGTWVANLTPRPNYPRERTPIPIWYETGCDIEQMWTFRGRDKSNASACWSLVFEITYNISLLCHSRSSALDSLP